MAEIKEKVGRYIAAKNLFSNSDRLLVGLSGGADSVCLLTVLHELGYDLGAAHCNFHLRGSESDRDETFVRNLCGQMGIPLHVAQFQTADYAKEQGLSIEMAARELRYGFFQEIMVSQGYTKTAIAHHSDDNIETLFINLLRGTGIKGLCGIQPQNGKTVRPLLCCNRQEIMEFLKERGQDYVTDSTNLTTDYVRNKIRLEVLPLLESINPAARTNILTTIDNLNEEHKVYSWCTGRMEEECSFVRDGRLYVAKEGLMRSPSPLSLLHETLRDCGFNRTQLLQILRSMDKPGRMFYSAEFVLTIDRDYLIVDGYDEMETWEGEELHFDGKQGTVELPFGTLLHYEIVRAEVLEIDKSPAHAYLDLSKCGTKATIRHYRQGDSLVPFGMKGRKLVSDLLTDMKKSKIDKKRQLILEFNGTIAWVVGLRSSEEFKVDEKTQKVLHLTIDKD